MLNGGSSSHSIGQSEGGGSLSMGHSGGSGLSMYGSSSSVTGIVNHVFFLNGLLLMCLVGRKPVFGVSEKASFKQSP